MIGSGSSTGGFFGGRASSGGVLSAVAGAQPLSVVLAASRTVHELCGTTMPAAWAWAARFWGLRSACSSSWRVCSRAARLSDWASSEVAANDACCIWVLKQSSPTTPPSSTRLTRVTNGIRAARTRRRGTTVSRARVDGVVGQPRQPLAELEGGCAHAFRAPPEARAARAKRLCERFRWVFMLLSSL